jgi:putative phosphoserine phosphatase / 1-acylglycerol-3-phosphate O-acyltransferase
VSLGRTVKMFVGGLAILSAASAAMAVVRVLRPGHGRRICQEVVGGWAGDALLRLAGIELRIHRAGPLPQGPCFYMANHASTLDMPVLMALRLPDTRTFVKERLRWYGPLGAAMTLSGALFTAPQPDHDRRVQRFRDAERLLRTTGESVFGSPEGTRVPGPGIGPFNRGVFHLVTVLQRPIVPILIVIPPEIDPGTGIAAAPGVVDVHIGEPIDTAGWTLAALDANKEAVRDHFVAWSEEVRR